VCVHSRPGHVAFASDDLHVRVAHVASRAIVYVPLLLATAAADGSHTHVRVCMHVCDRADWQDHTDFPRALGESPLGLVTGGWDGDARWRSLPALA
jgi:hypothetical protein